MDKKQLEEEIENIAQEIFSQKQNGKSLPDSLKWEMFQKLERYVKLQYPQKSEDANFENALFEKICDLIEFAQKNYNSQKGKFLHYANRTFFNAIKNEKNKTMKIGNETDAIIKNNDGKEILIFDLLSDERLPIPEYDCVTRNVIENILSEINIVFLEKISSSSGVHRKNSEPEWKKAVCTFLFRKLLNEFSESEISKYDFVDKEFLCECVAKDFEIKNLTKKFGKKEDAYKQERHRFLQMLKANKNLKDFAKEKRVINSSLCLLILCCCFLELLTFCFSHDKICL